ncbi:MAG: ABC transporter permease [Betaproteobacteria bacterium]|nr:ABC transporter permease [Betaproteobacteria bacterium]
MNAFTALVLKDLKLYFSNKKALIITVVTPVAIAAFFGAMFGSSNTRPAGVAVAVVDADGSALSRALVASIQDDKSFAVSVMTEAAAIEAVQRGRQRAALVLPAGFGEAALNAYKQGGAKAAVVLHTDPSQAMAMGMIRGLLMQHSMRAVVKEAFGGNAGTGVKSSYLEPPVKLEVREAIAPMRAEMRKYNPYAHSFGGMSVQFLLFIGIETGIALLLARRMGLWTRLRAAPLSRGVLLGSAVTASTIIGTIVMLAIFAVGMAVFGVRIDGSVAGFLAVVMAFVLLTASFGLLLAALGNDPDATRGLAILATLLLVMLGGAWVPTFAFPDWMQTATQFIPTRWAVDGLAAMTWRGLGFEAAVTPALSMLAFAGAMFAVAVWRFKWSD